MAGIAEMIPEIQVEVTFLMELLLVRPLPIQFPEAEFGMIPGEIFPTMGDIVLNGRIAGYRA